jgi:tRNA threonylcarbamoyladenosine biosynthesis protein TsaB
MIMLALDASAGVESAALWNDGRLLDTRSWLGGRDHARPLFDALRTMLKESAVKADQIDTYVVGLGPGSFAGLRMAISCFQGMALPGSQTLYGLSSAEAAAAEVSRETGRTSVLVCGDGRRQRIWSGLFQEQDGLFTLAAPFRLDPATDMSSLLPPGGAVCTADWTPLTDLLTAATAGGDTRLVNRAVMPSAVTLGELARERLRRGIPSLPLSPLYLHPPVFVAPSFFETNSQETP